MLSWRSLGKLLACGNDGCCMGLVTDRQLRSGSAVSTGSERADSEGAVWRDCWADSAAKRLGARVASCCRAECLALAGDWELDLPGNRLGLGAVAATPVHCEAVAPAIQRAWQGDCLLASEAATCSSVSSKYAPCLS